MAEVDWPSKLLSLEDCFPLVISILRNDLKDHLRQNPDFFHMYFPGQDNVQALTVEQLSEGYKHAISNDLDPHRNEMAEYIATSWLMRNAEIYKHFEKALSNINPEFDTIHELDVETSNQLVMSAADRFGYVCTYLFCVLCSVEIHSLVFAQLKEEVNNIRQRRGLRTSGFDVPNDCPGGLTRSLNVCRRIVPTRFFIDHHTPFFSMI